MIRESLFGLELWRSKFHYISFYTGGDTKIHFSLLERFTQALYISYFFAYNFVYSIFLISLLVDYVLIITDNIYGHEMICHLKS